MEWLCISLVAQGVGHFFIDLLAICPSSFENYGSFVHLLMVLFVLLLFNWGVVLYGFSGINRLSDG